MIQLLSRLAKQRGVPKHLRSDHGPESVSHAILTWLAEEKIETALIESGMVRQNGEHDSFNEKSRDEYLNAEWFRARAGAKVEIEQ